MYKLYYSPGACSMAVHILLNELGQQYELQKVSVQEGQTRTPEYLKMNPRGQVPLLIIDGQPVKEGGAILLSLMERHNSPLLPKSGMERVKALEWLSWCNASLHGAYSKAFWCGKHIADKQAQADAAKIACEQIQSHWDEAEARLEKCKYLGGDALGAADILMAVIANWNQWMPYPIKLGKNVQRVIKDVIARPSYQKALKNEQVEYKAAA